MKISRALGTKYFLHADGLTALAVVIFSVATSSTHLKTMDGDNPTTNRLKFFLFTKILNIVKVVSEQPIKIYSTFSRNVNNYFFQSVCIFLYVVSVQQQPTYSTLYTRITYISRANLSLALISLFKEIIINYKTNIIVI